MLIRGLGDSVRTLFWTCVVIFFVTYVFAIFGLVIIVGELQRIRESIDDIEQAKEIDGLILIMGGLDKLMYTLIQTLILDSIHAFMRPLGQFLPWAWMYFYAYIAVACFVLMNLVTAIIVENAVSTSQNDHAYQLQQKEAKQHKDLKELKMLFLMMDADGSGTLSWDEFKESFDDPEMSQKWMLLDFLPEECKELFQLLDDGDGEIETNEFFEGLSRMKGNAQSKDVYRLQKGLNKLQDRVEKGLHHADSPGSRSPRSPKLRSPRSSKLNQMQHVVAAAVAAKAATTPRATPQFQAPPVPKLKLPESLNR